jgi:hypothetical protein
VDGTSAYFTAFSSTSFQTSLLSVPLGGGTVATLASSTDAWGPIVLDATTVYGRSWSNDPSGQTADGTVFLVPLGGGAATPIAFGLADSANLRSTRGLAIDSGVGLAFFGMGGFLVELALPGGGGAPLASGLNSVNAVAVGGGNVFWTDCGSCTRSTSDGSVMKVVETGGTPTPLATAQGTPADLVIDAANVYWTNIGTSSNDGAVMSVPIGGGTPTPLATGQMFPRAIAVDGTNVYWLPSGAVMKVPRGGGASSTLATGLGSAPNDAIAVDANCVYWTDYVSSSSTGFVMKAGK